MLKGAEDASLGNIQCTTTAWSGCRTTKSNHVNIKMSLCETLFVLENRDKGKKMTSSGLVANNLGTVGEKQALVTLELRHKCVAGCHW